MFVKIHNSYRDVVAVCDSDLIGKYLEEGNSQLEIKPSFFQDKEINEEECISLIEDLAKDDATFNIVGKSSVNAALKAGIISKEGVKVIQETPYALVLL